MVRPRPRRQGRHLRGLRDLGRAQTHPHLRQLHPEGLTIFAVSTLGCPGLPIDRVIALLHRHQVRGVQLRCAPDEPIHTGTNLATRHQVRRDLHTAGISLIGLATYVRLADGAEGLREHVELALDLGAPTLRLMPGGPDPLKSPAPAPVSAPALVPPAAGAPDTAPSEAVVSQAAEALRTAAALTAGTGIRLLIETHDAFLRGADLRRLLQAADAQPPAIGAIWDAMHPWRAGELPATTLEALSPWLAEIQIKDAASPTNRTPLVPGTGTVPNREVLTLARRSGFTGPIVLEHEARWHPDAAPIDDAIAGAKSLL